MKEYIDIHIKTKPFVIVASIVAAVLILGLIAGIVLICLEAHTPGKPKTLFWDETLEFDADKYAAETIVKEDGEDLVVLNLTDLQISTFQDTVFDRQKLKKHLDEVIGEVKPDLITVTGDQQWLKFAYQSTREIIKLLDSYQIPWAPVFGNHDSEHADKLWMAEEYMKSEYCIFDKGPATVWGVGNYFINVKNKEGKIIHTLMFFDSGSGISYSGYDEDEFMYYDQRVEDENGNFVENPDGTYKTEKVQVGANYDYIKPSQIAWYKWVIAGIAKTNNTDISDVQSSVFMHIALPEYHYAYQAWREAGFPAEFNGAKAFGRNLEGVCSPKVNTHFFEAIKNNNTKNVFVGHDHINYSSLVYEGVRLTYGLKTGERCYFEEGINGGTRILLNDGGIMDVSHYVLKEFADKVPM